MKIRFLLISATLLAAVVLTPLAASADRVRFPQRHAATEIAFQDDAASGRSVYDSNPTPPANGAVLGNPTFDPFATQSGAANSAPNLIGSGSQIPLNSGTGFPPPPGAPSYGTPYNAPPPLGVPAQPGYVYPNGINFPNGGWGASGAMAGPQIGPYLRLFQDFRFRYTWLAGSDGSDVDINDIELAATANVPNFLWSNTPLQISPVFALHLWDGPQPPSTADLPSKAYSAYGDFSWDPILTPQLSVDLNVSFGIFSDFQTATSDSFRIQGKGLFVLNLAPTVTLKLGVEYLDRQRVKLLPAGGVLWTPNDKVRFDIYFPRPKLAQYLTTLGNTDIWWYIGGEYGGGTWTIERAGMPAFSDRVDINDIRLIGGIEWTSRAIALKGFLEIGYVFDREVLYEVTPGLNFRPSDTVMFRGGLSY